MKIPTDESTAILAELAGTVVAASEQVLLCEIAERQARSEATAAINKLNQVQKALDEHIAKMKAAAPRDSDWGRAKWQKGQAAASP